MKFTRSISWKGFALIELIIVILITGIIAAVIVSPKPYLQEIRTQQAGRKIKSDIRYAQSYALKAEKRTRVSFAPAAESYSVYVEEAPGSWNLIKDPLTKSNFTVDFSSGEYGGVDIVQTNFEGVDFGLVFDAAGKPYGYNPAGGVTSALVSQGSVTLGGGVTITVEPNTGKVE